MVLFPASWHQIFHINGLLFILRLALVLVLDRESGNAVKIIVRILSWSADKQVLFFVNQIFPLVLTHLEIGRELDGIGRACFFTISAEDAPGKIDAEELGITSSVLVLRSLKRDAVNGTRHGAEIARNTALLAVRVAGKDNPAAPPGRDIGPLLRILDRGPPSEHGLEDRPD